jgi:aromatic ring-opening dioxygenase LigB subunit
MEELGRQMKKYQPHTIIIATPHGLRLDHNIGVVTTEYSEGRLAEKSKSIETRFRCNRQLARKILQESRKNWLPVVGANYGASEGAASCMQMDWGTLIPLWFFGAKKKKKPKIVIVTPSREIPLTQLVDFGKTIAKVAQKYNRKIAFVASADQGHAHNKKGPYGFHPSSKIYDELVAKAVKENNLKQLLSLTPEFIEEAKPDSLWQIAILEGILETLKLNAKFISYEAPTYFGLLCASFETQ